MQRICADHTWRSDVFATVLCTIADRWRLAGTLSAGGARLRLALHLSAAKDGTLTATLDSIDQGAIGIPVTLSSIEGPTQLIIDAVQGATKAQ